ncbi:hypothetical protein [Streptomyces sp. TRM64462]|uniref:hypothetical protein n=1 Tax=Streptomyces sp. TRM64462 TaxID=2741726 RepID=UPI001585D2A4|nr:hypothetical protein [Streptomyces sp. TRM64462]
MATSWIRTDDKSPSSRRRGSLGWISRQGGRNRGAAGEKAEGQAAAVARSPAANTRAATDLQEHIEQWCLESLPRTLALSPGDC